MKRRVFLKSLLFIGAGAAVNAANFAKHSVSVCMSAAGGKIPYPGKIINLSEKELLTPGKWAG